MNAPLSNTCRTLVIALCLVASQARAAGREVGKEREIAYYAAPEIHFRRLYDRWVARIDPNA